MLTKYSWPNGIMKLSYDTSEWCIMLSMEMMHHKISVFQRMENEMVWQSVTCQHFNAKATWPEWHPLFECQIKCTFFYIWHTYTLSHAIMGHCVKGKQAEKVVPAVIKIVGWLKFNWIRSPLQSFGGENERRHSWHLWKISKQVWFN